MAYFTVLGLVAALTVPFGPTAQANHGNARLEVVHDSQSVGVGTNAVLVAHNCTFDVPSQECQDQNAVENFDVDFEVESGPGDQTGPGNAAGNTPNSPDFTCTVLAGTSSCQVTYTTNTIGTDMIRAWIDHDKNNATVEADTQEGRISDNTTDCSHPDDNGDCGASTSEPPTPGTSPTGATCNLTGLNASGQEPDCTDVVKVTWTAGPPAVLDCEPETATNPTTGTGSSETYTCTLSDAQGNPANAIRVDGENMNGANDPDNSAAAGSPDYTCGGGTTSSCNVTVGASDGESGSADICFWFDSDNDDVFNPAGDIADGGDCDLESPGQNDADLTDTVQKIWQARSAQGGGLDAELETDVNALGSNHQITATVYDQFGAEFVSATTVNFEFFQGSVSDADGNMPDSPDLTCTTNNSSSCSVTFTSDTPGRDRLCVWTNATPTMSGDNQTGTCDGESLNDPDDTAGSPDAPEPVNDDVDVVEKIWEDPGTPSRLDCEPETDTNPVETTHEVTCTATDASGTRVVGAHVDVEATGANDPDGNSDRANPDFTCQTGDDNPLTLEDEAGTCSVLHGPDGGVGSTGNSGLTTYTAWIDADDDNGTVEADNGEGRDEAASPGNDIEPDDTDVVEKTWVPQPASLSISPEADTASVGACNPFTITALNASNQPAQGAVLDVEQLHELAQNQTSDDEPRVSFCEPAAGSGPNPSGVDTSAGDLTESPDNEGTAGGETEDSTNQNGRITIGIRVEPANGSDGTGRVDLTVWFETTDNDDPEEGEPQDDATKFWVTPEARTIDCEPENATRMTGSEHTVTCTVRDRFGDPVEGKSVTATEEGQGDFVGATEEQTDAEGQATFTVGSSESGEQTVTGTITESTENEPDTDECERAAGDPSGAPAGECADDVAVTWQEEEPAECEDGVDNDGDGQVDFPADPGCSSPEDDDEADTQTRCPAFQNDPRNQIVGTNGDDELVGTPGDDIICGLRGDDVIRGRGGNDLIIGGRGNDELRGGADGDEILGNRGSDLLVGGGDGDLLKAGQGKDELRGRRGHDVLRGHAGDDVLRGGRGNDRLNGGPGRDRCRGGRGNDRSVRCES